MIPSKELMVPIMRSLQLLIQRTEQLQKMEMAQLPTLQILTLTVQIRIPIPLLMLMEIPAQKR